MYTLVYYLYYSLIWTLTLLPLPVLYIFSDLGFLILYYLVRYRKKVVMDNLGNSFPEKPVKEIRKIARRFYRHYCDQTIEALSILHMSPERIKKHMHFVNIGLLDDLYSKGKSIIAVLGHYGNWEWLASLPLWTPYQTCSIYKPLVNKKIDNLFIRMREKFGNITIPMDLSLKKILEFNRQGKQTITVFLTDQRPIRRHIRYWTLFMNQSTPVLLGAERIAVKTNQSVVFFHIRKLRRGYYETEFNLIAENPGQTREYEITEMHVRKLEEIIREKPEYWLWSHRRWRHNRERYAKWAEEQGVNVVFADKP